MFKSEHDSLVELIRSLSKAEKRHFKIYARRNAGKVDPLFLQLFDHIEKAGGYSDHEVLHQNNALKKSQLPNLRSKLYKELLASLRLLRRNDITEIAIREQLDYAMLLHARGLYRQSLILLERARSKAMEHALHPLALEIVTFEKYIESQHVTQGREDRAGQLMEDSRGLSDQVQKTSEFMNLSLALYNRYLKMGHARNESEVREVERHFKSLKPHFDENELGFHDRIYLCQSYIWLYTITHDFPRQYRYAQKWLDTFEAHPHLLEANISLYLRGIHNVLISQFNTLRHTRFCTLLDLLTAFNHDGRYRLSANELSQLTMYKYVHRLNRHFLEGTFSEGTTWVIELIDLLEKNAFHWDGHRVLIFYYKIACLYFAAGDNKTAIDFLNRIINTVRPDIREDIQCFARVLSLIAHYELGNALLVSHQLRSVYRFLLKMRELSATMSEILAFLRRTRNILPGDLKSAFVDLKARLEHTSQHPYERRAALYLDITSWLDSKIEARPVEEVIRDKFLSGERRR